MAMSDLAEQPDKSVWLASGSRANAKAVYRMLKNERFEKESVLSAHRDAVSARSESRVLLAVQDTMSVNYNTHTETEGLGYNCDKTLGVNVHSCLLLTTDGIPLGLLDQSVFTRAIRADYTPREQKRARPIEEKESYRWLETMHTATENAPKQAEIVHIADREADIYELYALAEQIKDKFVIRAVHNRLTVDKTNVIDELKACEASGAVYVVIPENRSKKTKEREALMTVQFKKVSVQKPAIRRNDSSVEPSLDLTLIRLYEENPSVGLEPVEWILITNLEVKDSGDALRAVEYYKQRWKIERFHFVLKSGCEIEKIQQRSVNGIELMLLMYSIISIHIMQLTFLSRSSPETSCEIIFSEPEWKTLYRAANRTTFEPENPPNIAQAVRLVAKLGGHVGAKSDGEPGLKVIWLGLNKLFVLVTYRDFL
jgi:hypothetical protein